MNRGSNPPISRDVVKKTPMKSVFFTARRMGDSNYDPGARTNTEFLVCQISFYAIGEAIDADGCLG
jgi:hypothetical protein